MNPPDETMFSIIKDWLLAPVLALIAWAWTHLNKRTDDLKTYVDTQDSAIKDEVTRQRDVSAKIFDKLDEHSKASADRHIELLKTIHEGLARKADK